MQNINIALIQSDIVWGNIDENLYNFSKKLDSINQDIDIIILPEMFSTAFIVFAENVAESMNGKAFCWLQKKAKERNAVICASVIIKENKNIYNRLFWMQADGSYHTYDKRHLFRMGEEHKRFSAGKSKLIVNHKQWNFCPLVCYDLRFPVWSKNRFSKENYEYDCLIYIANWPASRSPTWKSLLVARAIENQSYVVGVNRIGKDGNHTAHQGDSMVVDPTGKILYHIEENTEDIAHITLRKDLLDNYREKFNVGQDWDEFEIF